VVQCAPFWSICCALFPGLCALVPTSRTVARVPAAAKSGIPSSLPLSSAVAGAASVSLAIFLVRRWSFVLLTVPRAVVGLALSLTLCQTLGGGGRYLLPSPGGPASVLDAAAARVPRLLLPSLPSSDPAGGPRWECALTFRV